MNFLHKIKKYLYLSYLRRNKSELEGMIAVNKDTIRDSKVDLKKYTNKRMTNEAQGKVELFTEENVQNEAMLERTNDKIKEIEKE